MASTGAWGSSPAVNHSTGECLSPVILAGKRVTTAWCYVAGPGVAGMLVPTGLTKWGQNYRLLSAEQVELNVVRSDTKLVGPVVEQGHVSFVSRRVLLD